MTELPMNDPLLLVLRNWQAFYQLTGEVAGTLIGLMFVAMSLGSRQEISEEEKPEVATRIRTFASPTILHLSAVVAIAANLCIPVHNRISLVLSLCLFSVVGMVYGGITLQGLRQYHRQQALERTHWTWHFRLPMLCYFFVFFTGILLLVSSWSLALLAVAVILFLAIGIRNSWTTTLLLAGLVTSGRIGPAKKP